MRIATTASAVLLALSTAGLAQVAGLAQDRPGTNVTAGNATGRGNATIPVGNDATGSAGNMLDNAAAPPPGEPR